MVGSLREMSRRAFKRQQFGAEKTVCRRDADGYTAGYSRSGLHSVVVTTNFSTSRSSEEPGRNRHRAAAEASLLERIDLERIDGRHRHLRLTKARSVTSCSYRATA
jgi:hypothetical protein